MLKSRTFLFVMKNSQAGPWTTLGGGILIFVLWQAALVLLARFVPVVTRLFTSQSDAIAASDEALGIIIILVGGFGAGALVLFAWRKLVDRASVHSLFTAERKFRWSLAVFSCLCVGALGLGLTFSSDPEATGQINARLARFSLQDWTLLSVAYGIGIIVQATFEEIFVRGWLLQHVGRFVPSAFGSVVVTSVVFSAIHVGHAGWATFVIALVFGLAFGWSAIRLNGLEAAIGAHIGNNLLGALLSGQMLHGNPPTLSLSDGLNYVVYVLGFLLVVEVWVRFFGKPSLRA
jgi:uncharacterized protein